GRGGGVPARGGPPGRQRGPPPAHGRYARGADPAGDAGPPRHGAEPHEHAQPQPGHPDGDRDGLAATPGARGARGARRPAAGRAGEGRAPPRPAVDMAPGRSSHPGMSRLAGFVAFVREVVDRFGPNPRVVGLQVTNEVNFTVSPDSSDGAYQGARDALIAGVIAAKDEARRRGFGQLTVGFNWFYRTDPNSEAGFWGYLRDHGGPAFAAAVDWVGLDAYPGTVFPPVEAPGGERDGMVAAMSQLRRCFMPIAGLGSKVPIHVEENGWPTGPGRVEGSQAQALQTMVRAMHDFRGTYGVPYYRWFDLRDHNTSSTNFQHHFGLPRHDSSPTPA